MKKFSAFIVILFLLCGCVTTGHWKPIDPNYQKFQTKGFGTVIAEGWMQKKMSRHFLMTKDGQALEWIGVERLEFGENLEITKKTFSKDMFPEEMAEIEIHNMRTNTSLFNFTLLASQPARVDDINAFMIEYTYEGDLGLTVHGMHYGFLADGYAYRIRYEAADQHYYQKHLDDFHLFVKNFKVL